MKKAKVGIVIPVYNVEQYLRQCIESILNQTLKDIQIVIVNDGSKDSSAAIIDEYAHKDSRIVPIHKTNGGISSARNEGLKYVNAEYVTFVDSDDWVDEDMYMRMYEAACNTNADIVSTNTNISATEIISHNIISEYLLRGDVSCCNKMFRYSDDIKNSFSFDPHNVSIDVKGCYDLFKGCRIWVIIPGAYYNYRQDNLSYGRSGFSKNDLNCVELTKQVAADVQKSFPDFYNLAYNHVIHAEFDIIVKAVNFGYKSAEDERLFISVQRQYRKDIKQHLCYSIRSEYFSKKEKIQMAMMSVCYPLYLKLKRVYLNKMASKKAISIKI